jgi:hypothetical protein
MTELLAAFHHRLKLKCLSLKPMEFVRRLTEVLSDINQSGMTEMSVHFEYLIDRPSLTLPGQNLLPEPKEDCAPDQTLDSSRPRRRRRLADTARTERPIRMTSISLRAAAA